MKDERTVDQWAQLRFAIIGPLLAAPPASGELKRSLESLARKTWTHPINGTAFHYSVGSLERFYYRARYSQDPVAALRPQQRCDKGYRRQLNERLSRCHKSAISTASGVDRAATRGQS